jgi:hypothetical protein
MNTKAAVLRGELNTALKIFLSGITVMTRVTTAALFTGRMLMVSSQCFLVGF